MLKCHPIWLALSLFFLCVCGRGEEGASSKKIRMTVLNLYKIINIPRFFFFFLWGRGHSFFCTGFHLTKKGWDLGFISFFLFHLILFPVVEVENLKSVLKKRYDLGRGTKKMVIFYKTWKERTISIKWWLFKKFVFESVLKWTMSKSKIQRESSD